jgi:hypothetical protein
MLNTIDGNSCGIGIFLASDLESSQSNGISGVVFIWGEFYLRRSLRFSVEEQFHRENMFRIAGGGKDH